MNNRFKIQFFISIFNYFYIKLINLIIFFLFILILPLSSHGYSLKDLKYKIDLDIINQNSIIIKSLTNAKEGIWNKQTFAATAKSNNGHYIFFGGGLYENTTSDKYKKRKNKNFIKELASSRADIIIDYNKILNEKSEIFICKKHIYVDWYDFIEKNNSNVFNDAGFDYVRCNFKYLIDIGLDKSIYERFNNALINKDHNFSFTQNEINEITKYEKKLITNYNFMTIYEIESFKSLDNVEYQLFNIETIYFYWRCVFLTKYERNIKDTFFCINPNSGFLVDEKIKELSNLILY